MPLRKTCFLFFLLSLSPWISGFEIILEKAQDYYYSSSPVNIRFIIYNSRDKDMAISEKIINTESLMLRKDGGFIARKDNIENLFQPLPSNLKPGTQIIQTIDIKNLFLINETGLYTLSYRNSSTEIPVIMDYDPSRDYMAIVKTDFGEMKIRFFRKIAPGTVKNFIDLANLGFYDGLTFHRVIPGFVIQGGCPRGDGTGDAGYSLKAEISDARHLRGTVSMARGSSLDSAGSQFFICLDKQPLLDFKYTIFGEVYEGMDTADKIASVKTTGHESEPFDSPVEPVYIRQIIVRESGN